MVTSVLACSTTQHAACRHTTHHTPHSILFSLLSYAGGLLTTHNMQHTPHTIRLYTICHTPNSVLFPSPLLVYVPCLRLPRPPRRDGRGATYRIPVTAYGGKSVTPNTLDAVEVKVPVKSVKSGLALTGRSTSLNTL